MKINFGKHKGKEMDLIPTGYLRWLIKPEMKNGEVFSVNDEIKKEAKKIIEQRDITEKILKGTNISGKTLYVIERLGDISGETTHESLKDALDFLEKEYPKELQQPDMWTSFTEPTMVRKTPDPEDDRILIWEVLVSGHKKVVWHFSGWHWDSEEFDVGQGSLPGDERSLYDEAMLYY